MKKYTNKRWLMISALAIGAGFVFWLSIDQEASRYSPPNASAVNHQSETARHANERITATAEVKQTDQNARISSRMLKEFNSAQSYRAFIYSAIKHPEQGGYAYALHVLTECGRIAQWEKDGKFSTQQGHALDLLRSRCDISAEEREDFLREINADRQLNAERDPMFQILGNLLPDAKSQSERDKLSQQLLEWADPLSVGVVQTRENYTDRNGESHERVFLAGQWYEGSTIEQMNLGWQLANCELGQACGADATETLKICLTRGWCASSVQEAILQGNPDPVEQKKLEIMKTQIVNAIQTRNLRAFISPRGNPPALQ